MGEKKCKHGECGSCGVTAHPWCFEPAPAPLPESVESALCVVSLSEYPSVESVLRFHISDLTRRLAEAEARVRELEAEVATERAKREVMESASESYRNIAIEFSDDFRDAAMKEKLFKVDRRHAMAFLDIDKAAIAATEVKP